MNSTQLAQNFSDNTGSSPSSWNQVLEYYINQNKQQEQARSGAWGDVGTAFKSYMSSHPGAFDDQYKSFLKSMDTSTNPSLSSALKLNRDPTIGSNPSYWQDVGNGNWYSKPETASDLYQVYKNNPEAAFLQNLLSNFSYAPAGFGEPGYGASTKSPELRQTKKTNDGSWVVDALNKEKFGSLSQDKTFSDAWNAYNNASSSEHAGQLDAQEIWNTMHPARKKSGLFGSFLSGLGALLSFAFPAIAPFVAAGFSAKSFAEGDPIGGALSLGGALGSGLGTFSEAGSLGKTIGSGVSAATGLTGVGLGVANKNPFQAISGAATGLSSLGNLANDPNILGSSSTTTQPGVSSYQTGEDSFDFKKAIEDASKIESENNFLNQNVGLSSGGLDFKNLLLGVPQENGMNGGYGTLSSFKTPDWLSAALEASPQQVSNIGNTLKNLGGYLGTGNDIAGLIYGLSSGTDGGGGRFSYGTNAQTASLTPAEAESVQSSGSWNDRQMYDMIEAIKSHYQSIGKSGSTEEQQAIAQLLSQQAG